MQRDKISACLTVCNEERNIERCLKSLTWADEIVVVDSFSSDRTVELCRKFTDRIRRHEWLGYVGQKGLARDMAGNPWIFFVDGDEEVSPELKDEILSEFESGKNRNVVGYEFARKVFYLGSWVTHGEWWPDVKLRLFLKEKGRCVGTEPHDRVEVDGPVKRLKGCLHHYTYESLSDQIATLNNFTSISCENMRLAGRRSRARDMIFRPALRFIRAYLLKKGFMEGGRGFIIAVVIAFGVFLKYAKLWEALNASRKTTKVQDG